MKLSRRSFVGLAVAAVAATGCSSKSSSTGSTATAGASASVALDRTDFNEKAYEDLKDGGTYTTSGSFSGTDTQGMPWNVNSSLTGIRLWNWYNPIAITFSTTGEVLVNKDYYTDATSETKDGKQVVTITINPKAKYNDGTPIDWHSLEQTWKINNGSQKNYQIGSSVGWDQIESVKQGTDDRQAVITFAKPYSGWPSLFSTFINPKAATVDNFNNAYSNKLQPQWGAGPFTVESYDANSKKLIFKRNPNWWGRTARLDKRIYLDFPNTQAAINAFKNGQIDMVGVGTAEYYNQVKSVQGTEIRQGGSPFQYSLFANGKSTLLSDVNVRHAVFAAIDRKQLAQIQFQGLNYSEPLPGSNLFYSWQTGYQDNLSKVLVQGPDEASKVLEGAGWAKGSDGIYAKGGQRLSVGYTLFDDDPTDKAMAASIVAAAKKAGIEVKIQPTAGSEWSATINGGKFDLVMSGNRSMDPYGAFGLGGFYGSKNPNNITRVGSAEVDAEIEKVNAMADATEQVKAANETEVKAMALYGVLPLFSGPSTYAVKKDLANVGATLLFIPLPETIGYTK